MKFLASSCLLALLLAPICQADGTATTLPSPSPAPATPPQCPAPTPQPPPNIDPNDPPHAPPQGPAIPACSNNGKDISSDVAAILDAIKSASFCWQAVQLADSCAAGEGNDANYVNAAAPKCEQEFEKNSPTGQDRALLATMRAACDGKFQGRNGSQYVSANALCKLKAWLWMDNLTSSL